MEAVLFVSNRNGVRSRSVLRRSGVELFPRDGQHQLDPVFLINLGCTRVVVNGDDVRQRVELLDGVHDAFPADVVGQTAERLHANDVGASAGNELHHFGRQEPAFAHFDALTDDLFTELHQTVK